MWKVTKRPTIISQEPPPASLLYSLRWSSKVFFFSFDIFFYYLNGLANDLMSEKGRKRAKAGRSRVRDSVLQVTMDLEEDSAPPMRVAKGLDESHTDTEYI